MRNWSYRYQSIACHGNVLFEWEYNSILPCILTEIYIYIHISLMKQITWLKTKYHIMMFRIIFNIFIRFKWQKLFFNILSLETSVTNCLGRQVFSIFRICSILRDWASTSQDLMHGVYELRLKSLCYRTSVTPYYMAINAYTCFTLNIKVPIMLGNLFVNCISNINYWANMRSKRYIQLGHFLL